MMKKRLSSNDILNELDFTVKQKKAFQKCIQIVKDEQKNETIDAEREMEIIIEGVAKDEV